MHAEEVTSYIDERLRREAAGELPPTAGQTDAVDAVFTAALHHVAALNDFAATLVNASTVSDVAHAFTQPGSTWWAVRAARSFHRSGTDLPLSRS